MAADPQFSKGAREERARMRAYLRRRLKHTLAPSPKAALEAVVAWVLGRQKRYDTKAGGLGRK